MNRQELGEFMLDPAYPPKRNCEARVTIKLFKRWFPNLKKTFECDANATWVGTHSCCGSTSRACEGHHTLAVRGDIKSKQIKCGECGADSTLMWRKL